MNKYSHLAPPKPDSAPPVVTREDKELRKKMLREHGKKRGGVNAKRGR